MRTPGWEAQPALAWRILCLPATVQFLHFISCQKEHKLPVTARYRILRLTKQCSDFQNNFFFAGQWKLGEETSQICFSSPGQGKNFPGQNVQIFVGWEDKSLKSPRPVASSSHWTMLSIWGRDSGQNVDDESFYFEQQNENLRVGSGFKIHSLHSISSNPPPHPLF